jgi:hypothetical protein
MRREWSLDQLGQAWTALLDGVQSRGVAWLQRRVPLAVPAGHGGVEHLGVDDDFAAPAVLA